VTGANPQSRAQELFLNDANIYGCAEATLVALQEHYQLPDAGDFSAAMALNGGIAYSGSVCGAITGAAMAVGRLTGRRIADHAEAKRVARQLVQKLMASFVAEQGSVDCRSLTGFDFTKPGEHKAFIQSGIWRDGCMRQIEFAVGLMGRLADPAAWDAEVESL
jgi:C_GCAxxG_C_C family probable redox protein